MSPRTLTHCPDLSSGCPSSQWPMTVLVREPSLQKASSSSTEPSLVTPAHIALCHVTHDRGLSHGGCHMGAVTWGLSHGGCHMGGCHMGAVTWGLSHGGCHMGAVTWGLSHGGCHMGAVTWGLSHGGCHLGAVTWGLSHGGCHMGLPLQKRANGIPLITIEYHSNYHSKYHSKNHSNTLDHNTP